MCQRFGAFIIARPEFGAGATHCWTVCPRNDIDCIRPVVNSTEECTKAAYGLSCKELRIRESSGTVFAWFGTMTTWESSEFHEMEVRKP
jgi:hypothetical protein